MRSLAPALVALLLLAPSIARADLAAQARFHDGRARAHYEAGRYEEAIQEFFFEQRMAPNPRIVFNLALCFERLRRLEDAYMFYAEYLDSGDPDPTRRTYVEEALGRLGPRVARVRIESDPVGATIYVDERAHGSYGVTPRVLALAPGRHTVWLEREGHRGTELTVETTRGAETTVSATLEVIAGSLRVETSAPGTVTVRDGSGASVGIGASPFEARLAPGPYSIEIASEGHRAFRELATVESDSTRTITAELEALPPPTGEVTVTSNVAGAVVELDGEPAGFAPVILPGISLGEHELTVRAEGLDEWTGTVGVEDDVRSWLTVQLVEPAETTRSEWTWIVGGTSLAAFAVWGALAAVSVSTHDQYDQAVARGDSAAALRDQGVAVDTATDVTLGIALVTLATAVVLFFATEHTEARSSTATVARQAR